MLKKSKCFLSRLVFVFLLNPVRCSDYIWRRWGMARCFSSRLIVSARLELEEPQGHELLPASVLPVCRAMPLPPRGLFAWLWRHTGPSRTWDGGKHVGSGDDSSRERKRTSLGGQLRGSVTWRSCPCLRIGGVHRSAPSSPSLLDSQSRLKPEL